MVRRFIQDENIEAPSDELDQCRPAAFTTAQLGDGLIHLIAHEPKTGEKIAHALLGGLRISFWPDGANDRQIAAELLQVLIVVAKFDEMPNLHSAGIRLFLPKKNAQKR